MNSTVKTSERFSKLKDLRASVPFFPLPYSPTSPSTFLLSPHFARPECEELPHTARISFASYGNACYAGYPQTCQYTFWVHKIKRSEMIADYGDGGQKMLDIMGFNKSLKITWIAINSSE